MTAEPEKQHTEPVEEKDYEKSDWNIMFFSSRYRTLGSGTDGIA